MANAMYTPAKEGLISGEIDWDTATITIGLVRNTTAGSAPAFTATHKFVSDLTATHTIAASATLGSKTITGGAAGSANGTFGSPAANTNSHIFVLYQSSAATGGADVADTAKRLIAWYDTGTGLPIASLNGGEVTFTAPAGGWFTL